MAISLRKYAHLRKKRGLPGGSPAAVQRAVHDGRLGDAVTYDRRGNPKIKNAAQADREWLAATRPRIDDASPAPESRSEDVGTGSWPPSKEQAILLYLR